MTKKKNRLILLLGFCAMLLALSAFSAGAVDQVSEPGASALIVGQKASFSDLPKGANLQSQNENIAVIEGKEVRAVGVGYVEITITNGKSKQSRYVAVQLPGKSSKPFTQRKKLRDAIHNAASAHKKRMHFRVELESKQKKSEDADNKAVKQAIEAFVPDASDLNIAYCDTYYLSYLYRRIDEKRVEVQVTLTFGYNPGAAVAAKFKDPALELTKEEALLYQKCIAIIDELGLEQISPSYEKALVVHDYLLLNCAFDVEATQKGHWLEAEESYNAYGALVNGQATCKGYAQAMKLILDSVGVPCDYVVGKREGWHAWNRVQLDDGKWYNIDPSADDPIPDVPGRVSHTYFCITDKELAKTHSWEDKTHSCNATAYSYANIQKLLEAKQ